MLRSSRTHALALAVFVLFAGGAAGARQYLNSGGAGTVSMGVVPEVNDAPVTNSNPLPVSVVSGGGGGGGGATGSVTAPGTSGTQAQAVQGITGGVPVGVSATSLPLPAGAATETTQQGVATSNAAINTATGTQADAATASGANTTIIGALRAVRDRLFGTLTVSGTVTANLGTLNGAATAAGQAAQQGPVAPGAASTNSVLGGQVYNATPPAPTNGQQLALQSDAAGNLKIANATLPPGAATSAGQASPQTAGSAATGTGTRVMGNDGAAMRDIRTTTTGALEPPTAAAGKITVTSTALSANTSTTIAAANANRIALGIQCASGGVSISETGVALTSAAVGSGSLFIPAGTGPYFNPPVATLTAVTAYTATAQTCAVTEYLR